MIAQPDPVCRVLSRVVYSPGHYQGVHYRAAYTVLAFAGDTDRCFGQWRTPAPVETRALVWRHSSKDWQDRMLGYQTTPTALQLLVVRKGATGICIGPRYETTLHEGGRLSLALLRQHAYAINAHFGGRVVGLDPKHTIEVTPGWAHGAVRVGSLAASIVGLDDNAIPGLVAESRGRSTYVTGSRDALRSLAAELADRASTAGEGWALEAGERAACRSAARALYKQLGEDMPAALRPRTRRRRS